MIKLTTREEQVLYCLADGMTMKEIAIELDLSLSTVVHYSKSLYSELGAKNAANAVAIAYHEKILIPKEKK